MHLLLQQQLRGRAIDGQQPRDPVFVLGLRQLLFKLQLRRLLCYVEAGTFILLLHVFLKLLGRWLERVCGHHGRLPFR